ncbi:MAG: BBP7 family outer membrane beta-barrel protein [Planctomycetaceae bacterium]
MWSSAWKGFVGLILAVGAVTTATAGRAEEPFCCDFPCRLLDPLGQDPVWTGRADALLLWRDAPQAQPLFQYTTPDFDYGDVAMDASGFQSGMASGPRFALFRHTGDMGAIEFNYLRVQSFTASQTLPVLENGYYDTEQGLYCCTTQDTRDGATGLLSSSLQSAEVNRRFPTDGRLGWLMGFRWVEWNDALGLASVTSYPSDYTNSYLTRASNDLYGMQVGADSILYGLGRPFRVEGIGKAGIFYNDARQSSRFSTTADGGQTLAVSTSVGRAAFVGELGVTAVYDVTERISLRAGYAIFWFGGLALAPAQYGVNTLCPGNTIQGATDTSGSVVVQGLSLGLEARW